MRKTENYREHHRDIRLIISDIKHSLSSDNIDNDPENIALHTRKLFGKFGTHLAIEDKAFYPKAINHPNTKLSKLARQFQDEMGGLGEAFHTYKQKWPGPIAISKNPNGFVKETQEIIFLLEKRLEREEGELYELYDQVM